MLPAILALMFADAQYLMIVRAIRMVRIFRVLKLRHYLTQANFLLVALRGSKQKIIVFLVSVSTLVTSLVGLWGIYTLIFAIGAYFFFKLVRRTPEESLPAEEQHDDAQENRAPRHPFSRRSRRDS